MAGSLFLLLLAESGGLPEEPVSFYGPIATEWPVEWIGPGRNATDEPYFPELEWPDCARFRRLGRLCHGVRPPRSLPRGLRFVLPQGNANGNGNPPGVAGAEFSLYDAGSVSGPLSSAAFNGSADTGATVSFNVSSASTGHSTLSDPLAYGSDDFVLRTSVDFQSTDNRTWRLFGGPKDYAGAAPLAETDIPSLAIARRNLPPPVNKERSWVFKPEGMVIPPEGLCGCSPRPPFAFRVSDLVARSFDTFQDPPSVFTEWQGSTPGGSYVVDYTGECVSLDCWQTRFSGPLVKYRRILAPAGEGESSTWQIDIDCFGTNSFRYVLSIVELTGPFFSQTMSSGIQFGPDGNKCLEDWPRPLEVGYADFITDEETDFIELDSLG